MPLRRWLLQAHAVTTTVRVSGGGLALLPVVSVTPVPKDRIFDRLRLLRDVSVAAPIAEGTIAVSDALGLGVDRAARDIASVQ